MKTKFIFILLIFNMCFAKGQSTYFNNIYNPNNIFAIALSVEATEEGYVVFGVTRDSTYYSRSVFFMSLDSIGNFQSCKTISDSINTYWGGYYGSLAKINSGGFIAAGHITHPDMSIATLYRFDDLGDTLWTRQYTDPISNMGTRFMHCNVTSDNGFILTGYRNVKLYNSNIILIKTDSLGNELFCCDYGDTTYGNIEHGYSVVQTPDEGFFLGYYHYYAGASYTADPIVMKLDSIGNFEWELNLGGPYQELPPHVCLGNDGTLIAGASVADSSIQGNIYSRIYITKLSVTGNVIWENKYCQTEFSNFLNNIYPDHDGGYIATGYRRNYFHPGSIWNEYGWLLKIDENGDSVWYREYQYYSVTDDDYNKLYDLCLAPDGGYVTVGQASTWTEPQTAWVIKVDSLGCDTPGCATGVYIPVPQVVGNEAFLLYPNPANSALNCRLQIASPAYGWADCKSLLLIYDMIGRKMEELQIPKGQELVRIDVSSYPAGIYIAVLKNEKRMLGRRKFVVK
jgi:hypothetical protein